MLSALKSPRKHVRPLIWTILNVSFRKFGVRVVENMHRCNCVVKPAAVARAVRHGDQIIVVELRRRGILCGANVDGRKIPGCVEIVCEPVLLKNVFWHPLVKTCFLVDIPMPPDKRFVCLESSPKRISRVVANESQWRRVGIERTELSLAQKAKERYRVHLVGDNRGLATESVARSQLDLNCCS